MFGTADPAYADNQILSVGGRIERLGLDGWQALLPGDKRYSGYLITYGNTSELVADTNSEDLLAIDARTRTEATLLRPLPGKMQEGLVLSPDGQ